MVYVLLVRLFVYFVRVNFCPFSLPLGFRGWLQFVIVALLGLFYLLLYSLRPKCRTDFSRLYFNFSSAVFSLPVGKPGPLYILNSEQRHVAKAI